MKPNIDDMIHDIAWWLAELVMKYASRSDSKSSLDQFLELKWFFTDLIREALNTQSQVPTTSQMQATTTLILIRAVYEIASCR